MTVLDGRAATSSSEIALGAETLRQLHVRVGQSVQVMIGPATHTLRIVGKVVFPASPVGTTLRSELGAGAQLTAAALAPPLPPGAPAGSIYTYFPVRFGAGKRTAQLARLRAAVDPMGACPLGPCVVTEQQPATVHGYGNARTVEYVLVALVAMLGLAAIVYAVGMSIRRRRHDFAILKGLGFVSRQLSWTLLSQSWALTGVTLVVGIPIGIAFGRIAWSAFANGLGVGTDALVPVGAVAIATTRAVAVAAAVAAAFAVPLERTEPALVLRTE